MTIDPDHIDQQIINLKRTLRAELPDLRQRFQQVEDHIRFEVDAVRAEQDNSGSVIPELNYADIVANNVSDSAIDYIKRRGAVIIRQVFERQQAEDWDAELASYINDNGYYDTEIDPKLDQYFSQLNAGRPQSEAAATRSGSGSSGCRPSAARRSSSGSGTRVRRTGSGS